MKKGIFVLLAITIFGVSSCSLIKDYESSTHTVSNISSEVSSIMSGDFEIPALSGAEYNIDELQRLNKCKGISDFEYTKSEDNIVTIRGIINVDTVKDENSIIKQLNMIRSIIGLKNPGEQLEFTNHKNNHYEFTQCYNGMKVYSTNVTIEVSDDDNMIHSVIAQTAPIDAFDNLDYDIKSESEIKKSDPKLEIDRKMIWCEGEYKDKPIIVYIAANDFETKVIDTKTGIVISSQSNVMF